MAAKTTEKQKKKHFTIGLGARRKLLWLYAELGKRNTPATAKKTRRCAEKEMTATPQLVCEDFGLR